MYPSHLDEHGRYTPTASRLAESTIIFDRKRNQQVMVVEGVVVLPVGAEVELLNPNVNATVVGVRLLAGNTMIPVQVSIDVDVPAEYWGDNE